MRQSQKTNRPRNKNGRKPSGPSPNRVYESSGPEGKVRGTPQQIVEKYQSLARDKATAGDRVMAEAFLQHAEHYLRLLAASQPTRNEERSQEERAPVERNNEDFAASGSDASAEASADGMAVIGEDDPNASGMVETPEHAGPSRRRGRRPARRPRGSEEENKPELPLAAGGPSEPSEPAPVAAPVENLDQDIPADSGIRAAE